MDNQGLTIEEAFRTLKNQSNRTRRSMNESVNTNAQDSNGTPITDDTWYICFDHFDAGNAMICTAEVASVFDAWSDWFIYPITKIEPGKKSLISNDDESAYEWAINVDDAEWLNILKDAYKQALDDIAEYGVSEECGPCYLYYEEGAPELDSEQKFIDSYNDFIDSTFVDKDSSSQYVWYTADDLLDDPKVFMDEED